MGRGRQHVRRGRQLPATSALLDCNSCMIDEIPMQGDRGRGGHSGRVNTYEASIFEDVFCCETLILLRKTPIPHRNRSRVPFHSCPEQASALARRNSLHPALVPS